jgi:16S rRNA (guanine527-N7)-methyltransferase
VKHLQAKSAARLHDLLDSAGVHIDPEQAQEMVLYLDELLEVNLSINLTRITVADDALRLHLADAALALPEVLEAPSGGMIDLGSGGGVPGVPLGIASGRPTVLLDSVAKKGSAVEALLARTLPGRPFSVVSDRAEDHARTHPEAYAVVVARAVASLPALVELASPLLMRGGVLVALKGDPLTEELESGNRVAKLVGFSALRTRPCLVPGGGEHRIIVSATKLGNSKVRLPRRNGLAQHNPLA